MSVKKAVECYSCLKKLSKAKSVNKRKQILMSAPNSIYTVISDIARNILKGIIPINTKCKKKLKLYKNQVRKLGKATKVVDRKKIVNQHGGFLSALLVPALSILAKVVTDNIG